jgi:hypothetical protein
MVARLFPRPGLWVAADPASGTGGDDARADITGFAWECLRRNQNYQRDRRGISPTSTVSDEFRQRWGLCFRS